MRTEKAPPGVRVDATEGMNGRVHRKVLSSFEQVKFMAVEDLKGRAHEAEVRGKRVSSTSPFT